jgi:hypothetical protein
MVNSYDFSVEEILARINILSRKRGSHNVSSRYIFSAVKIGGGTVHKQKRKEVVLNNE